MRITGWLTRKEVAAILAYDVVLYSDAVLFQTPERKHRG